MNTQVLIRPAIENDPYCINVLSDRESVRNMMRHLSDSDYEYTKDKLQLFSDAIQMHSVYTGVEHFISKHRNRISLAAHYAKKSKILPATIYPMAAILKNGDSAGIFDFEQVKQMMTISPRRAVVRFLEPFCEYHQSVEVKSRADVSCMAFIQYLPERPRVVFRASDLKDEFLTDFITLHHFFIEPVYGRSTKVELNVFCTCAQNVDHFDEKIDIIKKA